MLSKLQFPKKTIAFIHRSPTQISVVFTTELADFSSFCPSRHPSIFHFKTNRFHSSMRALDCCSIRYQWKIRLDLICQCYKGYARIATYMFPPPPLTYATHTRYQLTNTFGWTDSPHSFLVFSAVLPMLLTSPANLLILANIPTLTSTLRLHQTLMPSGLSRTAPTQITVSL